MSKGPITNPSIAIQPSKVLIDFIKALDDPSIALPENLLRVYQAFTSNTEERKIDRKPIPQPQFTADEEKRLKQLHDEKPSVDLDECLKALALNGSTDSDDSISDLEADQKEENVKGKNKARRERAKQKEKELSKFTLNLNDLRWIHRYLNEQRAKGEDAVYLHELLNGSKLVLPQNDIVERNPELEARCQRLRREQNERTYQSMTKNVDCSRTHAPDDTISYQMKQINRQLIAVLQFVASVLAGFAFGFLGVELMIGTLDFGFRLLLGIICSLVIALAELYFLAKKLNEDIDYEGAHQEWLESKTPIPDNRVDGKRTSTDCGKEHAD